MPEQYCPNCLTFRSQHHFLRETFDENYGSGALWRSDSLRTCNVPEDAWLATPNRSGPTVINSLLSRDSKMTQWGRAQGSTPGANSTVGQPNNAKASFSLNGYAAGNYLKATDLKKPTMYRIDGWDLKTYPARNDKPEETKPVLHLQDADGGTMDMGLNATNAATLQDQLGLEDSLDAAVGAFILLVSMKVQGPNGMTDGIRIAEAKREAPQ